MKTDGLFRSIYQQLNPAQRKAVDVIDGPVMVIAGPGTGKTQVLAARVANILTQTDTNPSSILALTFTEVAATNMRQRLYQMIGSTAYQVRIMTFHGFCNDVILSHPEYFSVSEDAEPISDLEFIEFLRNFLSNPDLEYLRTARSAYHYLHAARSALLNIKKEGLSVAEFKSLVDEETKYFDQLKSDLSKTKKDREEKRIGKIVELAGLYQQYQTYLKDNGRYDYEDMILWVADVFESKPELLLEYQEKLHYFLVDEYQDTNSAQNKVLDQLASFWGDQANVFVVGDPNQTIYRFQGASMENVLGFTQRYSEAQVITLEQGYRCPQPIYDAAAEIIAEEKYDENVSPELHSILSTPLQSTQNIDSVYLLEASTDSFEKIAIVEKIKELIESGVSADQIAVLFKKNKQALQFIEVLKKWQISYQLERDENILESEFIRQLLVVMKTILAIRQGEEAHDLYEVMLYEWVDLDKSLVMKLLYLAGKSRPRKTLFEYLEDIDQKKLDENNITPLEFQPMVDFVSLLKDLAVKDLNMTFLEWFPLLMTKLGLDKWLVSQEKKSEWLQQLNAFYGEIKSLSSTDKNLKLARFLEIIEAMVEQNLAIRKMIIMGQKEGVVISTAHGSKGKEWQYVFIPECADKIWGNARAPIQLPLPEKVLRFQPESKQDKNSDDRRLFYVSLTRAKKAAYISFPTLNEESSKSVSMSMFVGQLKEKTEAVCDWQTSLAERQEELVEQLVLPSIIIPDGDDFRDWVKGLVDDFKLSPTALDSYLKSPEDFLFNNILRIPRAKSSSLVFGSAVHATLEYALRWWQKQHKLPDMDTINTVFEQALAKETLVEEDYQARLKQGHKVLESYFNQLNQDVDPKMLEYNFGVGGREIVLDSDIKLTGKVDRVDWIDQKKGIVKVIDYKTGKVKTKNQIEGKAYVNLLSDREKLLPESIRGSLKRQLLFYKMLADLDPQFKGEVAFGELDFVESWQQSGKSGKVVFELDDNEVEDLKNLIRMVMVEIRELKFLD